MQSATERGIATLAIVVSEDGGIDLIPNFPPMIKRSLVSAAVDEVERSSRADRIPRWRYNEVYDWLSKHRFYLLPDDCERSNASVQEIERRFAEQDPGAPRIVRQNFKPDPKMQPSFYYAPEDDG